MNEIQRNGDKFNMQEKWLVFGFLSLYLILCLVWYFHTNAPWDDDCVGRYFNCKVAFSDPEQFISLWNRPLFMVLFALPFQFGKNAILLMAVLSAAGAYALYKAAKELKIQNAFIVVPFLLFQAFYFTISRSALAEPLAAVIISFSLLFYVRKQLLPFAILGGLLPLARLELSVLMMVWAYVLYSNKQWKYMIWLVIPSLLWSLAGTVIDGDPFWLYNQTIGKDNSVNMYGHTTFGHYFQRYIYTVGPFLFYFFFIGLAERLYKRKYDVFLMGAFIVGFMVYVVFSWKLNLGQAAGFLRHMAVISPLASVLALYGFNYWIDSVANTKSGISPSYVKTASNNGKSLQQRINEIQKKGEQDGLKPKQIRYLINAEKLKEYQAKSNVVRLKQKPKNEQPDNIKYRVLFYSIVMILLAFLCFSKKLLGHHTLSTINDYTNIEVIGGLTLVFIILLIAYDNKTMISAVKYSLALVIIGCMMGYTLHTEPPDIHNSPERTTMGEVSDIYVKSYLKNYPTYVNHIWFFWANDINKKSKLFNSITDANITNAPDSSIVIWESHYSRRLSQDVDLNYLVSKQFVELFRKTSSDHRFTVVVLQKIKQPTSEGMLKIYDRLLAAEPELPVVYFNKANLEFNKFNNFNDAIRDYSKAIELDTTSIDSYYNRGLAFINLTKYKDAENDFTKIILLNPDYDLAYFNRAIAYSNTNEPDKAIADYGKVIELKPGNGQAYFNRGMMFMQMKQAQNGCADLQKAIQLEYSPAKASLEQYCK